MILGTPLGHEDFVRAQLEHIVDEHNVLLERIPSLPDVQSAWALLLHCANARANYALRVIRPELARHFAQAHDAGLWRCLCAILRVGEDQCDALAKDAASLPLSMGGLWVAQRRAHEQQCTLGELGRFIVHGQGTPPWGGGHDR